MAVPVMFLPQPCTRKVHHNGEEHDRNERRTPRSYVLGLATIQGVYVHDCSRLSSRHRSTAARPCLLIIKSRPVESGPVESGPVESGPVESGPVESGRAARTRSERPSRASPAVLAGRTIKSQARRRPALHSPPLRGASPSRFTNPLSLARSLRQTLQRSFASAIASVVGVPPGCLEDCDDRDLWQHRRRHGRSAQHDIPQLQIS
jgi:hypothetical protein